MGREFDEFVTNNEIRIGKDFQTTPPPYYESLNDAFANYFQTFRNNKNTYHFLMEYQMWGRESVGFSYSNTKSTVFTILGFHRFFELLLKDLLGRIDPFLAVKFPMQESDSIKYLNDELSSDDMQTLEFKKTFDRFKEALKYEKENPDKQEYAFIRNYSFLNDGSLNELAKWRNRIMHNGKTLPNIYVLDYLVSQKIIPLVEKVIKEDHEILKNYKLHFSETFTGIRVISEMRKIKYHFKDFEDTDPKKIKDMKLKILRLGHLKEIGRATYQLDNLIKHNQSYYDSYYTDPQGRNLRFAEAERNNDSFHDIKKCPCCGFETLVVYRQEFKDILNNNEMAFISWVNCYACTYSIKENMYDPQNFGYSKIPILATE